MIFVRFLLCRFLIKNQVKLSPPSLHWGDSHVGYSFSQIDAATGNNLNDNSDRYAKVNDLPEYYNTSIDDPSPIVYIHQPLNLNNMLYFGITLGVATLIGIISVILIYYFACRHQTKVITIIQEGNKEIIQHDGVVVKTKIRKDVPPPRAKTPKIVRKRRLVKNESNVSLDEKRIRKMNSFARRFTFGD